MAVAPPLPHTDTPPRAGAAAAEPVLRVEGLEKQFGENAVLRGVDLAVRPGEAVAVLGANGCGKSTMLRCAIRLLDPTAGRVWLGEHDLAALDGGALRTARREAAMIFQNIALVPRRTAFDNVCLGGVGELSLRRSASTRLFPEALRDRAAQALDRVGLAEKAWQRAGTLSGGQAQRIAIARACCQQARIVLADEPVSALDPRAADDVLALLRSLAHDDGLAVVAVLHQPELALRHADRIVGMERGRIAFDLPAADVQPEQIDALYRDEREAAR